MVLMQLLLPTRSYRDNLEPLAESRRAAASIRSLAGRLVACAALTVANVVAQSPTETMAPVAPAANPSTWLVGLWAVLMAATLFALVTSVRRSHARRALATEAQPAWTVIVACGLAIVGLLGLAVSHVFGR